jgi:hypothetical protein
VAADDISDVDDPPPWVAADLAQVASRSRAWLSSEPLRELVVDLGGPAPDLADPDALRRWSAATLDTRAGAERRAAAAVTWDPNRLGALIAAAGPLGLLRTAAPLHTRYDAAIMLGGTTTGNRLRVELTADLLRAGIEFTQVVALTAERSLSEHERDSEPDSADEATEWRNLLRYLDQHLGGLTQTHRASSGDGHQRWRDEHYKAPDHRAVRLLVAPSSIPQRRATSADAIAFFAEHIGNSPLTSGLVITSAIYAPYQYFVTAPRLLRGGLEHVELIGTATATDGQRDLLAQRLGQEIHAAILAATAALAHAAS